MKLAAYLERDGVTIEQFADAVGSSVSGVRKWLRGERTPRPEEMRRIATMTKGEVTPNDFVLDEVSP